MSDNQVQVNSRTVEISKPDKIMFPDSEITKRDLVDYYQKIAEKMLPHMREHPLNMQRFPDGIDGESFYEKAIPEYFPDWIDRADVNVKGKGEIQSQVVCNDAATLVYLADQACITSHIWLSQVDKLDYPDKMIFDLDPPGEDFEPVRFAARVLRDVLDEVELDSFLMTTGSRGLHVVIPLDRSADFDTTREFARDLVNVLAEQEPDRLTTEVRKDQRKERLFLDYLRNSYGQTSIPPYSLRARAGAPVAAPLDWEELNNPDLVSQTYNISNIFRRLGQKEDPWKDIFSHAQKLESHRKLLDKLMDQGG